MWSELQKSELASSGAAVFTVYWLLKILPQGNRNVCILLKYQCEHWYGQTQMKSLGLVFIWLRGESVKLLA